MDVEASSYGPYRKLPFGVCVLASVPDSAQTTGIPYWD